MKANKKTYTIFQRISAIFMIFALLWLTLSTPFVFAGQQSKDHQNKTASADFPLSDNDEESANPFGNTTEEKASANGSISEEYLHNHHVTDHFFSTILRYHHSQNADTYIAFHGELLVPPPNAA